MTDHTEIDDADDETMVRSILTRIGEDPNREGLLRTPERVAKSWDQLFSGYKVKTDEDLLKLLTVFKEDHDEMVVLRDIEFYSTCEHHMLPFTGRAHVGYLPNGYIVGISKLARLVEVFARRLQVQERLGSQVVDALQRLLHAEGAGVILEAQHLCMTCRGVGKQNSVMVTSHLRGSFRDYADTRAEFFAMVGK